MMAGLVLETSDVLDKGESRSRRPIGVVID